MTVEVMEKSEKFVQAAEGGVEKVTVPLEKQKERALTDEQARTISRLMVALEEKMSKPQDFEWGMENGERQTERKREITVTEGYME